MKRFWKAASVKAEPGGHAVLLDGRGIRTPKGERLLLPGPELAQAVAAEWQAVETEVRPHALPLTGLANAAIDIVAADAAGFAAGLAVYAETDLLCYRADDPLELAQLQASCWGPLLGWAEARYDIVFKVTRGVLPIGQPRLVSDRIGAAYRTFLPFQMAALSPLVALSGSAVIPLALAAGAVSVDAAWQAANL
ncbi:MAG: ATP12 family protein, partial [Sandaracinobacteroides sp.]